MMTVLQQLRARAGDVRDEKGNVVVEADTLRKFGIHIVSENNFPTAAGLASSASGFATLGKALATSLTQACPHKHTYAHTYVHAAGCRGIHLVSENNFPTVAGLGYGFDTLAKARVTSHTHKHTYTSIHTHTHTHT